MLAILTDWTDYSYFKLFYILLFKMFPAKTPFLYQTFKKCAIFHELWIYYRDSLQVNIPPLIRI